MARVLELTGAELLDRLARGSGDDLVDAAGVVAVLRPDGMPPGPTRELAERVRLLPAVIIAPPPLAAVADVVPESGTDLEAVVATVEAHPLAATALAMLVRHSEGRSVADGLLAESA